MSLPYTVTLPITTTNFRLDVTSASTESLTVVPGDPTKVLVDLRDTFHKFLQGDIANNVTISTGLSVATGLFTLTSNGFTDGDTVTIGGIVFVAKTSPSTALQFGIGASAIASCANLATLINSYTNTTNLNGSVGAFTAVAGSSTTSGTVAVAAAAWGSIGNCIATTASVTGSYGTWGHTTLTGGKTTLVAINSQGL